MSRAAIAEAIQSASLVPIKRSAWRFHKGKYQATDYGGAALYSGRYHCAPDLFPPDECWPALYLSLSAEVCIGEVLRHISPALLAQLNDFRLSEIDVSLSAALDLRSMVGVEIARDMLIDDFDYAMPQWIARQAINRGAEAIITPSATRLGDNLALFPEALNEPSRLVVVATRDVRLYVERGTD